MNQCFPKRLAVTGLPGSGKSSLCSYLAEEGAEVVSSDQLAHQLLDPQTDCGKQIIELLGEEVLQEGKFDRGRIAEIVFADCEKLKNLERLIHPRVLEEIEKRYQKTEAALFVVEVPLLFEEGWEKYFDQTVLVLSNRASSYPERLSRFVPNSEKIEKADFVIENNGSLEDLKKQSLKILTTR